MGAKFFMPCHAVLDDKFSSREFDDFNGQVVKIAQNISQLITSSHTSLFCEIAVFCVSNAIEVRMNLIHLEFHFVKKQCFLNGH